MKNRLLIAAALAAFANDAAQANSYVATMTGVEISGVDYIRTFGPNLVGSSIVTFAITYDLAGNVPVPNQYGYQLFGGSQYGGAMVISNVTVSNDRATLSFPAATLQGVGASSGYVFGQSQASFAVDNLETYPGNLFKLRDVFDLRANLASATIDLGAIGSYQVLSYEGNFFTSSYTTVENALNNVAERNLTTQIYGAGTLSIAEYVAPPPGGGSPGGVPEPASWMMLIAGFGLVGGTLRRARVRALA